jgi:flagellar assembly protein FliH
MDALIRAARIAPARRLLSEARPAPPPKAAGTATPSRESTLRAEIEQQVRAEASAELRRLAQVERERAQAEGVAAARDLVAAQIENLRAQTRADVDAALTVLERAHAAALAKLESSVGEIAFAAVCRFVGSQAGSKEFVRALVEQACASLRTETLATVRLHPRDVAMLDLEDGAIRVRGLCLAVVPDESLALGGCIVEAASGKLDGGLESQLARLRAALTAGEAG